MPPPLSAGLKIRFGLFFSFLRSEICTSVRFGDSKGKAKKWELSISLVIRLKYLRRLVFFGSGGVQMEGLWSAGLIEVEWRKWKPRLIRLLYLFKAVCMSGKEVVQVGTNFKPLYKS